jgi:hypothetical protein
LQRKAPWRARATTTSWWTSPSATSPLARKSPSRTDMSTMARCARGAEPIALPGSSQRRDPWREKTPLRARCRWGKPQAQTEAELTLPPGKHKLTLQFAKYDHSSYGKAYAKTINVTVK